MKPSRFRIDSRGLVALLVAELLLGAGYLLLSGSGTTGLSTLQLRTAAPTSVNLGGVSAAEGTSLAVARADHVHSLSGNALINTAAQTGSSQSEILVGLTSTAITVPSGTRAFELCNNGASTIWCNPAGASVVSKSRPIVNGACWALEANETAAASLSCITQISAQVAGAATTFTVIK